MPLYYDPPGKDEPDITSGMEVHAPGQDPQGQMTAEGHEHDYRLSDDEYSAARQIAHNTGQPVQVMDVTAEPAEREGPVPEIGPMTESDDMAWGGQRPASSCEEWTREGQQDPGMAGREGGQ